MLIVAIVIIIIEMLPIIRKRQGKEASVLILLGTLALAYGYYYNTHRYSTSLVDMMFSLLNIR